jgi:hypothetical protein
MKNRLVLSTIFLASGLFVGNIGAMENKGQFLVRNNPKVLLMGL